MKRKSARRRDSLSRPDRAGAGLRIPIARRALEVIIALVTGA